MFRKKQITVKMEKAPKKDKHEDAVEPMVDDNFGEKIEQSIKIVEKVAVKAFAGVCVYILLDTFRQCAVESVKNERDILDD